MNDPAAEQRDIFWKLTDKEIKHFKTRLIFNEIKHF
jgi:hypothetical protein